MFSSRKVVNLQNVIMDTVDKSLVPVEKKSVYKFRVELEGTVTGSKDDVRREADKALEKVLRNMLRGKLNWNTEYDDENLIEESSVFKLSSPKIMRRFILVVDKEKALNIATKLKEVK
jgi:hypothetical protein